MYKIPKYNKTTLNVNKSYEGETIEMKMSRIINNGEPIKDGAPLIYEERGQGVNPGHNIRTDRFEIAIEAMDKVTGSHQAAREERAQNRKKIGQPEPIQGKEGTSTDNK